MQTTQLDSSGEAVPVAHRGQTRYYHTQRVLPDNETVISIVISEQRNVSIIYCSLISTKKI